MKIVVLDGYAANPGDLSWDELKSLGECTVYDRTAPAEVLERAAGADILMTNKVVLDATTIAALPQLKYIGVLATGYNIIDTAAAKERGITVTNIPAYSTPSVAQMVFAHILNIAQQVQHREASEFKKDKLKVLAELTKLRQICCDPRLHYEDYKAGSAKLDTCMELVHGALDGGHRILLFSQFTGMLDIIGKRLAKEDIAFFKLTGASSKESRAKMVAQFQAGEVPVFLISLKAGGVGLNLTAADVVIHYDPWWNVAAQNQATDRAYRIGQQNPVQVYKLIAQDTIEEKIVELQQAKQSLADTVTGTADGAILSMRPDELLQLLEGSEG